MDPANGLPLTDIKTCSDFVMRMIEEGRMAHACCFLFIAHKTAISHWIAIKRELLFRARDARTLQIITTLLNASKASTLKESAVVVPGLDTFVCLSDYLIEAFGYNA